LFLGKGLSFQKITDDVHEVTFFELWVVYHDKLPPIYNMVGGRWATIPQPPDYKSGALPLELLPPMKADAD
jgi:hypothetical protein